MVQYILTPDHRHELYMPRITVNTTGADKRLSFDLTLTSPGSYSVVIAMFFNLNILAMFIHVVLASYVHVL